MRLSASSRVVRAFVLQPLSSDKQVLGITHIPGFKPHSVQMCDSGYIPMQSCTILCLNSLEKLGYSYLPLGWFVMKRVVSLAAERWKTGSGFCRNSINRRWIAVFMS